LKSNVLKSSFIIFFVAAILFPPTAVTPPPWVTPILHQEENVAPPITPVLLHVNSVKYVIIVGDPSWADAVMPLARWKTLKGIPSKVYTVTSIYANFSGEDNATKIRNFIKAMYDAEGIQWVLLVGDIDKIPIRYFTVGSSLIPSDYYYAALNGSFDKDGDGRYGEPGEIDWVPEVYVGRIPASSKTEVEIIINKTLMYEQHIKDYAGPWMNTVLLVGGEIDPQRDIQGWRAKHTILQVFPQAKVNLLAYDSRRDIANLTEFSFIQCVNEGVAILNLCSHGSSTSLFATQNGVAYYTSTKADSLLNAPRLPLAYISACSGAMVDAPGDSVGESLLKAPAGGAIAVVGPTRTSFGGDSVSDASDTFLDFTFFKNFFTASEPFAHRPGYALYKAREEYYETYRGLIEGNATFRQEFLEYILLGDPELSVYLGEPRFLQVSATGLTPGKIASLRVLDENGNPVASALTAIQGINYYHVYLTDEEGEVRFPCPERGNYTLTITKAGYLPTQLSLEVGTPINILVDEYHQKGSSRYMSFWNSTASLRASLSQSLFLFHVLNSQITYETLKDVDILIIYYPSEDYSQKEIEAIRGFVRNGGSLLIIGEENSTLADDANKIAQIFNVRFTGGPLKAGLPPSQDIVATCPPTPQTFKVKKVLVRGAGTVEGGFPLIQVQATLNGTSDIFTIASSITWERGRVVFISDLDLWKNKTVFEEGNLQLFKSLCEWLAKDLSPIAFNIVTPEKIKHGSLLKIQVTADSPYDIINLTVTAITPQKILKNSTAAPSVTLSVDTAMLEDSAIQIYATASSSNGKTAISDVITITVARHPTQLNFSIVIIKGTRSPIIVSVAVLMLGIIVLAYQSRKTRKR